MFTNLYDQEVIFWQADYSDEEFDKAQDIAQDIYSRGELPVFSSGICDSVTAGYGICDPHGYWQYPLIVNQDTLEIEL